MQATKRLQIALAGAAIALFAASRPATLLAQTAAPGQAQATVQVTATVVSFTASHAAHDQTVRLIRQRFEPQPVAEQQVRQSATGAMVRAESATGRRGDVAFRITVEYAAN